MNALVALAQGDTRVGRGWWRGNPEAEMANRLLQFFRRHLVGDVPPALTLCFNCNRPECSAEVYRDCPRRLLGHDELASPPLSAVAKVAPPRRT